MPLLRIKAYGTENIPENAPFLICANHQSNNDIIVVAATAKHQVRFMAKASLFKVPIVRHFVKAMGAVPVDKSNAFSSVAGVKGIIKVLENGEVAGMYPQGHRYIGKDPRETPLMNGAGMIVYRTKVNVLPCCIRTKDHKTRPFQKTQVIYGKVIPYEEFGFENGGKEEYERASRLIFDRVCEMLDPDPEKAENSREKR